VQVAEGQLALEVLRDASVDVAGRRRFVGDKHSPRGCWGHAPASSADRTPERLSASRPGERITGERSRTISAS
jgi:hypothetical protein